MLGSADIIRYYYIRHGVHILLSTPIHPFTMARDEVDSSLITNERRKRKLPSYVTNEDNISADKNEVVKRMKHTLNPSQASEQLVY
jgi:hypothetical protein